VINVGDIKPSEVGLERRLPILGDPMVMFLTMPSIGEVQQFWRVVELRVATGCGAPH
jgi:hypothetical protein